MPSYQELMNPLLKALHRPGGSASIDEPKQVEVEVNREWFESI